MDFALNFFEGKRRVDHFASHTSSWYTAFYGTQNAKYEERTRRRRAAAACKHSARARPRASHQSAADALGVLQLDVPLDLLRGAGVADGPRQAPAAHVHGPEEHEPCAGRGHEERHGVQRQEQNQKAQVPSPGYDEGQLRGSAF